MLVGASCKKLQGVFLFHNFENKNMNHLTSIILGACILLSCFLGVKSCQNSNLKEENRTLSKKIYECENSRFEKYIEKHDTVVRRIDLNDSIKEIHQKEVKSLKYRIKIAKENRDTVTIIEVQEKTILQQDTIIKYLEKNDTLQKDLIAYQDTTIRKQNNEIVNLQEENKIQRKKKRKAQLIATLSTVTAVFATIKAVNK